MVKTLNVTLDDHDHERAATVKEELDLTWAEFVVEAADALEAREQDDIATSGVSTAGDRGAERRDRGEHPGRASTRADREGGRNGGHDAGDGPDTTESTTDTGTGTAGDSRPLSEGQQRALDIDDVLAGWRPGRTEAERAERRRVGGAVLRWLRDREAPASATDFKDELLPEHEIEGQSPETWWRKTARPALQHAREQGAVEYTPGSHTYEWAGRTGSGADEM